MIHTPKFNLAWRLKATFTGKLPPKTYLTPDIRRSNPGWIDEVFNRPIEQLEFFLPTGHRILLAGMEQYNLFLEATAPLTGKGAVQIQSICLCGKLPGKEIVELWRIKDGKVLRKRKPWGNEWGGSATRGWKKGITGSKMISSISEI